MGFDSARLKGIGLMIGTALAFAVMSAMFKIAVEDLSVFEVVFFRGIIGFLVIMAVQWIRPEQRTAAKDRKGLFMRALYGYLSLVLYVVVIDHVHLGLASALNQSSPMFVVLLSFFLLGERPRLILPVLVVIAFAGVCLIVSPDLSSLNLYAALGAMSSVLAALAYISVRKLRKTDTPWVIVRHFTMWGALLALPPMLVMGWQWPTLEQWLVLGVSGIAGLAGQLMMSHSYRLAEASLVSPFLYVCVLTSFLFGWFFWGEWPDRGAMLGC
ncbi:MAG: DMT family transporter, partial [Deltaproteobacteria bacterium]|nr:DMT family transporter [Deltaproteobacteria bacterium]